MTTKFQVTLVSSQRGDMYSKPAATRAEAFELARQVIDDCLKREKARSWFIGETVSVRVEEDTAG
jgi:hypothetical protein